MPPSILIIDDSPTARRQIIGVLKKASLFQDYIEAGDGIEGIRAALSHPVDVILCDLEMPGMDGFKMLGMLKAREELRDVPVIMITGQEDPESRVRGLESGASDYLTKPFDNGELLARVKVQLKVKSLQDRLKESNRKLLELSNTDPLTGLCNRRCLMTTLDRELKRSRRSGSPLSLVMADIDYFKTINDTFGHPEGDRILMRVADLLRSHLREYDLASRYGGEEFVLILPDTELSAAVRTAERLRAAASGLFFAGMRRDLRLTMSFGVATFPGPRVRGRDDLIREADRALYRAKNAGRDRVEVMPA